MNATELSIKLHKISKFSVALMAAFGVFLSGYTLPFPDRYFVTLIMLYILIDTSKDFLDVPSNPTS